VEQLVLHLCPVDEHFKLDCSKWTAALCTLVLAVTVVVILVVILVVVTTCYTLLYINSVSK